MMRRPILARAAAAGRMSRPFSRVPIEPSPKLYENHDPLAFASGQCREKACARSFRRWRKAEIVRCCGIPKFDASVTLIRSVVTPEEIKRTPIITFAKMRAIRSGMPLSGCGSFTNGSAQKTWMYQEENATLGQMVTSLDAVGCVCAGRQSRLSVLGADVRDSAKVAGVRTYRHAHPRRRADQPYLLVAADIAGVDEIYRVGGCRPSARWPWDEEHRKADKIVGPGKYVCRDGEAIAHGTVGIDMVAGPASYWWCGRRCEPAHVAADLLCEAEHDEDAQVYLVTTSASLAKRGCTPHSGPVEGFAAGENRGQIDRTTFCRVRRSFHG